MRYVDVPHIEDSLKENKLTEIPLFFIRSTFSNEFQGREKIHSFMKKGVSSMSDHEINEALMSGGYMNSEMSVRQFLRQHAMLVFMAGVMIIVLILGFLIYYIISSRKALRLARSNNELSEKAYMDLATGLPNKNKCEEIISSHLRITIPTVMFMLDLNDLKVVNDTLGHDMGDLMIMNFARILRQTRECIRIKPE